MSDSEYIIIGLASLFIVMLVFTLFKGIIRMLIMVVAVCLAIGVWLFMQSNNGATLVACAFPSAPPWTTQVLAYGSALVILMVFYHAVSWFSALFSLREFSKGGVVTTLLMIPFMLWLGTLGISYYGNISRVSYYHDLALAHQRGEADPPMPVFCRLKDMVRRAPITQWLSSIDPMDSPARTNLACLIAYGCTLTEEEFTKFYNERLADKGIPQPTRFLEMFRDKGFRTFVEEGRFVSLLENERLNTFVNYQDTEEKLPNLF